MAPWRTDAKAPEDVPASTKYSAPVGGTKPSSKTGSALPASASVPLVMRPDAATEPGGPSIPKARSPSGSFAIVDDPFMLIRPPGATPMVPSLVIAAEVVWPRPTVPLTVRVPVFMIGPSSVSPGSPDVPAALTVSDPSFCSPTDTVKSAVALAVLVVLAVRIPMVRLLPADTVSWPMEKDPAVRSTFALPEMQTSAPVLFGTPAVQLAAESQSPPPPPPVQVSLQLSVSAAGALPETKEEASKTVVVPATVRSPAATNPSLLVRRRRGRRSRFRRPAWRRPTLHSPRSCYGRRPALHPTRALSVILTAAPAWR